MVRVRRDEYNLNNRLKPAGAFAVTSDKEAPKGHERQSDCARTRRWPADTGKSHVKMLPKKIADVESDKRIADS